jgi:hypothetical protein
MNLLIQKQEYERAGGGLHSLVRTVLSVKIYERNDKTITRPRGTSLLIRNLPTNNLISFKITNILKVHFKIVFRAGR